MAQFMFLRLVPQKPVSADVFKNYLTDFDPGNPGNYHVLVLEAYDRSFAHPSGEPLFLGRAVHQPDITSVNLQPFPYPDPTQPIPVPTTATVPGTMIVQHRQRVTIPAPVPPPVPAPGYSNFQWDMKSVATAAIPITSPSPHEYDHPDVIIRVRWALVSGSIIDFNNAKLLETVSIDYNVAVGDRPAPFPPIDPDYIPAGQPGSPGNPDPLLTIDAFQEGVTPVEIAGYVGLVDPSPDVPSVPLPKDGNPPNFEALLQAVNAVMTMDPDASFGPANLTPEQARHVAYEIVWNRHIDPLPQPPSSAITLEDLYTLPEATNTSQEQARAQFEGALAAYLGQHDAQAETLANYVFALSAALGAQTKSEPATQVTFAFPIRPDLDAPTGGKVKDAQVTLHLAVTAGHSMEPALHFVVPAEYFYALSADLPMQVDADTRFAMVTHASEKENRNRMQDAIDRGIIASTAGRFRLSTADGGTDRLVTPAQAARRLRAFVDVPGLPRGEVVADDTGVGDDLHQLMRDWLAYNNLSGPAPDPVDDVFVFWHGLFVGLTASAQDQRGHLRLVVVALTKHSDLDQDPKDLIDTMAASGISPNPFPNDKVVGDFAAVAFDWWREFFHQGVTDSNPGDNFAFLPEFTKPGTLDQRIATFIRRLQQFFNLSDAGSVFVAPSADEPSSFGPVGDIDPLKAFFTEFPSFDLNDPIVESTLRVQVAGLFRPEDSRGRQWLFDAIVTLHDLFAVTDLTTPVVPSAQLRFSLMEALYARGFTSVASIIGLSAADFSDALTGMVAHQFANAIFAKAGGGAPGGGETGTPTAINPNGMLVNCIPPDHLSPLGPTEYLHELLQVSRESTCAVPFPEEGSSLAGLIVHRRGAPGDMLVTRANVETPLPVIDLVNESLEGLVANTPPGVVFNTASGHLPEPDGHLLRNPDATDVDQTLAHDPATLFAAMPEHSSPATPVGQPAAYDVSHLRSDLAAAILPYSQPLDICRSTLGQMRTSRFAVMRAFRQAITEFVLSPSAEPGGFRSEQWRFPVRLEIALEYLGINPEEASEIFQQNLTLEKLQLLMGGAVSPLPSISRFLAQAGLTYCDLVDLIASGRENLHLVDETQYPVAPPTCEPCCLDNLHLSFGSAPIGGPIGALARIAVFIRLWHKMQALPGARYTFTQLADIADVLTLFSPTAPGDINPDFLRQVAAFQMLRDELHLPLADETVELATSDTGAKRTHLLALWAEMPPDPSDPLRQRQDWAIEQLLQHIRDHAQPRFGCADRPPEFLKLLRSNLDPLSSLCGFNPSDTTSPPLTTWHDHPTHTLRFAEVLAKIFASKFSVGEIEFLFTAEEHLDGDDPFPLSSENEALDSPLHLPDDDPKHSLWALRRKLLDADVPEEQSGFWSWPRIEASLRHEFGYRPLSAGDDPLDSFAEHFFPNILACGHCVDPLRRRYTVLLAAPPTSEPMWNTPPDGPFHLLQHETGAQELWTELPLMDEAVLEKLSRLRPLGLNERKAVQDLYFAPRVQLAQLAFMFPNLIEAEQHLIQEPDETKRWLYFQRAFALAHARSRIIAEHLTEHVGAMDGHCGDEGANLAFVLLRSLLADENKAKTPWEDADGGSRPEVTWEPLPNGGAFAALLGLLGTGLRGELRACESESLVWREIRGPMDAFGTVRNAWNAPAPTILPEMDLTLSHEQLRFVGIRNGFALENDNAERLNGAEGFLATWKGVLLIEASGGYVFQGGMPTPEGEPPGMDGTQNQRWRVTLSEGQRSWVVLSHEWTGKDWQPERAKPISLRHGAYDLTVELIQCPPTFESEDAKPAKTGFQLKYSGPDTDGTLSTIPAHRLFIAFKDGDIDDGLDEDVTDTLSDDEHPSLLPEGPAKAYLHSHYVSTLRDIRRTYQRAFKALLFAHRLRLSAKPISDDGRSEIEFLLDHSASFSGLSFYPQGLSYLPHLANFDFNFLPVGDNYHPPLDPLDQRAAPSLKRQQAMFDWWERLFDYTVLRDCVRADSPEPPAWLLFHEAAENHSDDPAQLLRYLGIDLSHTDAEDPEDGVSLVLRFFNQPTEHQVGTSELTNERWPIRVWHADRWIRRLLASFACKDIRDARPDLWASDDPGAPFPTPVDPSGNENLTRFVQDGSFENGEPRRYEDLKHLNDGLRERARAALVAYLTARGASRVLLPWGGAARSAKDLSEFLLIDVEAGICQRASRIEEAVTAVQTLVQRARLGLEAWVPSIDFLLLWDRRFADFRTWQACKRKAIYGENWIEWRELQTARRSESFRYLEDQLRRAALTIAAPAGTANFDGPQAPAHPGIGLLQSREPSVLQALPTPSPAPADGGTTREGFTLLGTPDRHGRPSWLASPPMVRPITNSEKLPYWIEAAIRLGARFVRVAAAGLPMGAATFDGPAVGAPSTCCKECGAVHPPCVDEYYFWLIDSHHFKGQDQNADTVFEGSNPEVQIAWHSERALPSLLFWKEEPMVHLCWTRVHNGELKQMRRSREGVQISTSQGTAPPDLEFLGRFGDSLRFAVTGGAPPTPTGYPTDPKPGFRYDLPTDTAEVLPLVFPQPDPGPALITVDGVDLAAYPYFVYFTPGAPLVPLSFFSQATSVAGALRSHCRFEAALKWYDRFFNPLQDDASWCPMDEGATCCQGGAIDPSASDACAIARKRAITLNYLETLLDWGDALVRHHSPEAFQRARLVFDTASRILGVRPRTVLAKVKPGAPVPTVATFAPQPAPVNPRLLSLYERIGDRLSLLHQCINGRRYENGVPNKDMPYFGDLTVVNGWESTVQPCFDEGDWCAPTSAYRFTSLIPKAIELAGAVRAFGSELLAAFEKGDAEYLAALRTGHERQLVELALEVRKNQWREADWQVQAAEFVKQIAQTRRRYFQGLIDVGLISGEISYQALTIASTVVRAGGNIMEAIGQALQITPDVNVGMINFLHLPSGSKLGGVFHTIATIANGVADIMISTAGLNLTQAGWDRREAEWRHQVEVLDLEIQQDERQILAAERRRDAALHELNNQRRQMEQLAEVQDFLRDKFTSHELYLWLQRETAALYRQMYELALHAARQAQRAFNYERGHEARDFLKGELWSDLHEGLLAGERLETSLRQMDKAYIDENAREYELTKHVSLRQLFPQQLLQLKLTGRCEIELPEWLFDLDYPGHFMRRIKNISLSLPSVLGPFTGVHCRLTLLSSSTRIDPRLNGPVAMCCGRPVIDRTSGCCKTCGHVRSVATPIMEPKAVENGYPSLPDDPRIVRQYAAMEALATSSAQNDSGLFELNFRDERYLPFEFAGAVGRYRIELPPENNYFDFATITDLVMHLRYTAREGGDVLRAAAAEAARRRLPDGGERLLDIKMELPDVWHRFVGQPAHELKTLRLSLERDLFQYLPGQPDLRIKRLEVLFAAPCAVHDGVREPAQQRIELVRVLGGHGAADVGCAKLVDFIDCVESAAFPGLYHGVSAVDIDPVTVQGPAPIIRLEFPAETGPIERLFVVCLYEAGPADKRLPPCDRELKTSPCDQDSSHRP